MACTTPSQRSMPASNAGFDASTRHARNTSGSSAQLPLRGVTQQAYCPEYHTWHRPPGRFRQLQTWAASPTGAMPEAAVDTDQGTSAGSSEDDSPGSNSGAAAPRLPLNTPRDAHMASEAAAGTSNADTAAPAQPDNSGVTETEFGSAKRPARHRGSQSGKNGLNSSAESNKGPLLMVTKPLPRVLMLHTGVLTNRASVSVCRLSLMARICQNINEPFGRAFKCTAYLRQQHIMVHTGGTLGMDPTASYEAAQKGVSLKRGTGGVYAGAHVSASTRAFNGAVPLMLAHRAHAQQRPAC